MKPQASAENTLHAVRCTKAVCRTGVPGVHRASKKKSGLQSGGDMTPTKDNKQALPCDPHSSNDNGSRATSFSLRWSQRAAPSLVFRVSAYGGEQSFGVWILAKGLVDFPMVWDELCQHQEKYDIGILVKYLFEYIDDAAQTGTIQLCCFFSQRWRFRRTFSESCA